MEDGDSFVHGGTLTPKAASRGPGQLGYSAPRMKQWTPFLVVAAALAAGLAPAGCGGSSKPDPLKLDPKSTDPSFVKDPPPSETPPPAPVKPAAPARDYTCAEAQANVAAFTQHVSKTLARTLGAHCVQDKWQQEVINCFASTQDGPDLNLCTALLLPEQQRALESQNVADARDPNAPRDPACAVLDGTKPAPAPGAPTGSAAGGVAGRPVPLPTLGLPRGPRPVTPDAAAPAPLPAPLPAPTSAPAPSATGELPDDGVQRRTVAPKELEALRLGGDPKVAPDVAEQALVEKCNVSRVMAVLKLCIDDKGAPRVLKLLRTSRLPAYDAKLTAAMRTWRYKPYLVDGKPTEVCTAVTFIFAVR